MKTQVILIEQISHVKIMYDSPVGYPKGKRVFPWLVRVRIKSKKMIVVLLKVIMENFDDSFGSGFKVQGFYLVFYV